MFPFYKIAKRCEITMPSYTYQVPMSLDDAWQTSLQYWQKAYACEIEETRDTPDGGRFLLIKKKFDMSGVLGFKIQLQFSPSAGGVEVFIEARARGAQLSLFGRLIKDWCKAVGIPDQGVLGKSIGQSFKVVGICCLVLIIFMAIVFIGLL